MRIIVDGKTPKQCIKNVEHKEKDGWKAVGQMRHDDSYIGGRWVCVMEKADTEHKKKRHFNNYSGF